MVSTSRQYSTSVFLWSLFATLAAMSYLAFFRQILEIWLRNEDYSFGILVPPLVAYLIWARRKGILVSEHSSWIPGLFLTGLGCGLQVLASRSGTLVASGIALILTLIGAIGFICGKQRLARVAGPIALLVLMVPLPSYVVGELSWHLQSVASATSGGILGFLGVPVYLDGNLLHLPNYVLEVKQACSGSRSIFALLALACVLGLSTNTKFWARTMLVAAAPCLAIGANVIRIVGTGLIARKWGSVASSESLHAAWGIAVFLIAVLGLLGVQSLLRWATCKDA